MSATEFGTNDAQTRKVWGTLLMKEVMAKSFFSRFMGTDKNAILQRMTDLEKGRGDEIKYDLLLAMRGDGVQGDSQLIGFEEAMDYTQDVLKIDQLRNATDWMTMSQQRTIHDLRMDAKDQLSTWMAWKQDTLMFAYLAGIAGDGPENASGTLGASGFAGNALQAPDADHVVALGVGFDLQDLDLLVAKAKTLNPMIRPAMVDGKPKYCYVMHPNTTVAMKQNTNAGQWQLNHQQIAEMASKNPIYTGALGEYAGVILHESEHVPYETTPLVHNLFLGAQAATIAFGNANGKGMGKGLGGGKYFKWHEEVNDYDNKKGVAVSSIFGMKKTRYTVDGTSRDFGVIRHTTTDAVV